MLTGKSRDKFLKYCVPNAHEWTEFLRRHGKLAGIGENTLIQSNTYISDPTLTRVGNNVFLAKCDILGHDGCIEMINRAFDTKVDCVGPVEILDNVFVGHKAIILPSVTIGPNAIVGAGAIVTKDVPPNSIVGGVPARVIGRLDDLVKRLELRTKTYPWAELIYGRDGSFDPALEPKLEEMRAEYFWGLSQNHEKE